MRKGKRRTFLRNLGAAGAGLTLSAYGRGGPPMAAGKPALRSDPQRMVQLAGLLRDTPRSDVFEMLVSQIQAGASHLEVMGGVLLAGVLHINPRPVGFKLHAVMMTGSALDLMSQTERASRWLPIFWNADDFKHSQHRDIQAGDWQMPARPRRTGKSQSHGVSLFREALEQWDDLKADRAVNELVPKMPMDAFFEMVWPAAMGCFANIGHKIIYASQAYRALTHLGWQACGLSVMRSLVHSLLDEKPGVNMDVFRENKRRLGEIPPTWLDGQADPQASKAFWLFLKSASPSEASSKVIALLKQGKAVSTIWDGIRLAASDVLYRDPSLLPVHPLTATNGMAIAFNVSRVAETRKMLLLQAASWIPLYRRALGRMRGLSMRGDGLAGLKAEKGAMPDWRQVTAAMGNRRDEARQLALHALKKPENWAEAAQTLRSRLYKAGREHHQFKYTAAVLQEAQAAHPQWGPHILTAGFNYLPLGNEADSRAHQGTRQALKRLGL